MLKIRTRKTFSNTHATGTSLEWLKKFRHDEDSVPSSSKDCTDECYDRQYEKFANYFNNAPVLKVSGRTYPVDISYLSDVVSMTKYVLEKDSLYIEM